jgi:hypothetical protein
MGCKFCATGTLGIIGDLSAGEILEQLNHANAISTIRNVVFMGMGEPLNNYKNVKFAVEFMIDTKRYFPPSPSPLPLPWPLPSPSPSSLHRHRRRSMLTSPTPPLTFPLPSAQI